MCKDCNHYNYTNLVYLLQFPGVFGTCFSEEANVLPQLYVEIAESKDATRRWAAAYFHFVQQETCADPAYERHLEKLRRRPEA